MRAVEKDVQRDDVYGPPGKVKIRAYSSSRLGWTLGRYAPRWSVFVVTPVAACRLALALLFALQ